MLYLQLLTEESAVLISCQQGRYIEGLPLHANLKPILVNQKWRGVLEKHLGIEYESQVWRNWQ
jgi:hypothetical protein